MRLGDAVLKSRNLFTENYWYWIGVGAMVGYIVLFNLMFTFFISYLRRKLLIWEYSLVQHCKLQYFLIYLSSYADHIMLLFNLSALGRRQAVISNTEFLEMERKRKGEAVVIQLKEFLQHSGSSNGM